MTRQRRRAITILACAVAGAAFGWLTVDRIDTLLLEARPGGRFEGLHAGFLVLGMIMLLMGAICVAISASRRAVADNIGVDLAIDGDVEPERRMLRMNGLVLLVASAAMIIPGLGREPLGLGGGVAFAIVLALLVIETVLNYRILKSADELIRRATEEACVATFWIFQLLIFVWAVADHFELVPGFAPMDIVVVLITIYLLASVVIALRRGIGTAASE